MKTLNQVLLALGAAFLLTSCATQSTSTIKTMDIYGPGVIHKPVIVDLEVKNEKVTATVEGKGKKVSVEQLKEKAITEAMKKTEANAIVSPVYDVEYKFSKNVVTVTGYPAYYKNFRSIQESDIKLLEVGVAQKAEVKQSQPFTKKRKPFAAIVGGVLLVVLLVALL